MKYNRILLKLSGEALAGNEKVGLDPATVDWIATEIYELKQKYPILQIALVVGGGNFIRGNVASQNGLERTTADYMGMLATVINALAIQDVLEKKGIPTRVLSAIKMDKLCEPYIRRRAIRHLEKGRIVIFAAGTGNPYFSTDTAGVLRAIEINADIILKATKVDGVYDKDPMKYPDAKRLEKISYIDVLNKNLKVMDSTAISLCMENGLPIKVFKLLEKGNLMRAIEDDSFGSLVNKQGVSNE